MTVVLTTHYLEEAERLADQVHILDKGRLVASGSPLELTRGGTVATIRLVVTQPFPPGAPEALAAALGPTTELVVLDPLSLQVSGPADGSTLAVVSRWCEEHDVLPESLTLGQRNLEDVFLELTGRETTAVTTAAPAPSRPAPGAAPLARQLLAQAGMETKLLLRNGEQLLLAVVIPLLVLVGAVRGAPRLDLDSPHTSIDVLTPGVLALAVMSTAFTSLAIATGFERRYGVLKRLGTAPLSRGALLGGKVGALLCVEVLQFGVIGVAGLLLGWSPDISVVGVVLAVLLGTAAFAGLGMLLAGTLRAEATLAGANLIYLLLLAGGAVVLPAAAYGGLGDVVAWLPSGALGEAMRAACEGSVPGRDLLVLAALGGRRQRAPRLGGSDGSDDADAPPRPACWSGWRGPTWSRTSPSS